MELQPPCWRCERPGGRTVLFHDFPPKSLTDRVQEVKSETSRRFCLFSLFCLCCLSESQNGVSPSTYALAGHHQVHLRSSGLSRHRGHLDRNLKSAVHIWDPKTVWKSRLQTPKSLGSSPSELLHSHEPHVPAVSHAYLSAFSSRGRHGLLAYQSNHTRLAAR